MAASLGMCAGLLEGPFLRLTPRVSGLTRPDVSDMIWFLAPLVGSLLFALLGFVVAVCVAASGSQKLAKWIDPLLWGLTGAYLAAAVQLTQARSGWFIRSTEVPRVLVWSGVVFAWAAIALWALERRGSRLYNAALGLPSKSWAWVLGSLMAILVAGVAAFAGRPTVQVPEAKRSSTDPTQQPNIILVFWDTTRADHLSTYGYTRPTSPHLDRLASQGVLFENAVSPSSWTLPALASVFTSLLPHQHGANVDSPLDESPKTLAEILAAQGYETAGFNANTFYGLTGWGIAQGFESYDDISSSFRHNLVTTVIGREVFQPAHQNFIRYQEFGRRDAHKLNQDVYRWFKRRPNRPYFLFINYFDAHRRYSPPPPYNRRFGKVADHVLRKMDTERNGHLQEPLTAEERESVVTAYDNCLAYLDGQFAELLQFLASSPDWSNTYIIFTSDHGDAFGEHGTYDHGWNLYRELVHVPLIIAGPGVPHGLRVSHVVRTRELFSTILDIAYPGWGVFRRTSLRRYWDPSFRPGSFDDEVISELIDYTPGPGRQGVISLTTSEWQYLRMAGGRAEIYRWTMDPQEATNLAGTSEGQRTVEELQGRLYTIVGRSLRPWRGLAYLLALDSPQYSILRERERAAPLDLSRHRAPEIGLAQAQFPPDPTPVPEGARQTQNEQLENIPYF